MKIFLTYTVAILLLALLQLSVLPHLLGNLPVPNLLLLFTLIIFVLEENESVWGLNMENDNKWYLPLATGLILDIQSVYPFGMMTGLFLLFAAAIFYISRNFIESGINEKSIAIIIGFTAILFPLILFAVNKSDISLIYLLFSILLSFLFFLPLNLLKNV